MEKKRDFDYLCVPHYEIPEYLRSILFAQQEVFGEDVLTADGVELDHHITVFFGILPTSENYQILSQSITGAGPITIQFGTIQKFDSSEDYDVLYYQMESPRLHELFSAVNPLLRISEESYQSSEGFKPHITIAYVRKDAGDLLLGDGALTGSEFIIDSMEFQDTYERKRVIHL